jgi:hypothetical protein
MADNYQSLKIGKVTFKVLAWISAVLGLVVSVALFAGAGGADVPRLAGFVWILIGALYFLIFYVMAEAIQLLLEIRDLLAKK